MPPGPSAKGASLSQSQLSSSLMLSVAKRRSRCGWREQGICLGGASTGHTASPCSDKNLCGLPARRPMCVMPPTPWVHDDELHQPRRETDMPSMHQETHCGQESMQARDFGRGRRKELRGMCLVLCKAPEWGLPHQRFMGLGQDRRCIACREQAIPRVNKVRK